MAQLGELQLGKEWLAWTGPLRPGLVRQDAFRCIAARQAWLASLVEELHALVSPVASRRVMVWHGWRVYFWPGGAL